MSGSEVIFEKLNALLDRVDSLGDTLSALAVSFRGVQTQTNDLEDRIDKEHYRVDRLAAEIEALQGCSDVCKACQRSRLIEDATVRIFCALLARRSALSRAEEITNAIQIATQLADALGHGDA